MKLLLAIEFVGSALSFKKFDWVLIDSDARQRRSCTVSDDTHGEIIVIVELLKVEVDAVVARVHLSTDVGNRLIPFGDLATVSFIKSHLQSRENVSCALSTRAINREVCRA